MTLAMTVACAPLGWAVDAYEPDDDARQATVLNDPDTQDEWDQVHDFDPGNEADWYRINPVLGSRVVTTTFRLNVIGGGRIAQVVPTALLYSSVGRDGDGGQLEQTFNPCNAPFPRDRISNALITVGFEPLYLVLGSCGGVQGEYSISLAVDSQTPIFDEWEPDDSALSASVVNEDDSVILNSVGSWSQDHFFHSNVDQDWIAVVGNPLRTSLKVGGPPLAIGSYSVTVSGLPNANTGQAISIDVFGEDRLVDSNAAPIAQFNACDQSPQINYELIDYSFILQTSSPRLFRVRECNGEFAASPGYRFNVDLENQFSSAGGALISGTVVYANSGLAPVGPAVVMSSGNDFTFSNPGTGEFDMLATAGASMDLRAETEGYASTSVATGVIIEDSEITIGQPIQLVPKDSLFNNGFEAIQF